MTSSLGFYRDNNGILCVQNNKVSDLAKKYGTPLFIYDSGLMKERYGAFLDVVKNLRGNVHYAVKANDALGIINYLRN